MFAPLGGQAGFGNPGLAAAPQPWGHTRSILGTVVEVSPTDSVYTTPLAIEPAGDVSLSAQDGSRSATTRERSDVGSIGLAVGSIPLRLTTCMRLVVRLSGISGGLHIPAKQDGARTRR